MTTGPVLNAWQAIVAAANVNPSDRPRITQAMLAEHERLRLLGERRRQLRDQLVALLEQGAEIEPGPLWAELREREAKNFSLAKLAAIGGQQWAEDLKRQIEPTVFHNVIVRPAEQVHKAVNRGESSQGG
jgi:hypothetical protein